MPWCWAVVAAAGLQLEKVAAATQGSRGMDRKPGSLQTLAVALPWVVTGTKDSRTSSVVVESPLLR